jgi:hypothetical protein
MSKLPEPSKDLASRLLSEREYEERLVGYEMSPATGNAQRSLYSLQEAYDFVKMGEMADLLLRGGGAIIGYLDLDELRQWVGDVLGDGDLAAAVSEAVAAGENYRDRLLEVRQLMRERLDQCRAVVCA